MSKTPEELIPALRQYQHNDCSGFVAGYDKGEVDRIFAALKQENERLKQPTGHFTNLLEENDRLAKAMHDACDTAERAIDERNLLLARVAELESMYKPVYSVASGRYDSYMNELFSITDSPIPMADNFVLYRKQSDSEAKHVGITDHVGSVSRNQDGSLFAWVRINSWPEDIDTGSVRGAKVLFIKETTNEG